MKHKKFKSFIGKSIPRIEPIPTYCKGCSFRCQASDCDCTCHDKMREYYSNRENKNSKHRGKEPAKAKTGAMTDGAIGAPSVQKLIHYGALLQFVTPGNITKDLLKAIIERDLSIEVAKISISKLGEVVLND